MKKQITFLFLIWVGLSSFSQTDIKASGPCTDIIAQKADGRWIKTNDLGSVTSKDCYNRLDAIQQLVLKIYPEPKGLDAAWHRSVGTSRFGAGRNYSKTTDDRLEFDYVNNPHFYQFGISIGFFSYFCDVYEKNVLHPGYPGETGTWVAIIANGTLGEDATNEAWTINGLPVLTMKPAQYKEDGYEFKQPEPDRDVRHVLVYRKGGTLPYLTVTRKQYLDHCIVHFSKTWDQIIRSFEEMPVRSAEEQEKEKKAKIATFQQKFKNDPKQIQANIDYYLSGYKTDQQIKKDRIESAKINKEQELKPFTDEMEKSKNEGLLNSPAMIRAMYSANSIFETDPALGLQLITENPAYIRKDLPKHVPQQFLVSLSWNRSSPAKEGFAKIFQEKFPTDKLQAMIDK